MVDKKTPPGPNIMERIIFFFNRKHWNVWKCGTMPGPH
jgi:hypothetical protein